MSSPHPRTRSSRPLVALLVAAAAALSSAAGCAAPADDDGADSSEAAATAVKANTNPAAGKSSVPVVVISVDQATVSWIAGQTSLVDRSVVGDTVFRQRELYYRLQTAVNSNAIRPAVVHYGISFSKVKEARAITDAFSKAVDASPVPVVLEKEAGHDVDGTLYHSMAWSDPPNLIIGESLRLKCTDTTCGRLHVSLSASAPFSDSLPHAVNAGTYMATASTPLSRTDALGAADRLLGDDAFQLTLTGSESSLPRKISLKDLLTNPALAKEVTGAMLVVAPPAEVLGSTGKPLSLKLDDLKGLLFERTQNAGRKTRG